MLRFFMIVSIFFISSALFAEERPTLSEVKKVLNHYYKKGDGGFIVDIKLCRDIRDNVCINEVTNKVLSKGEKAKIWMHYFGPDGVDGKIHYEFANDGRVRKANEIKVKGSVRWRTNIEARSDRVGVWEVKLSQESSNNDYDLGTFTYKVNDGN